MTIKYAVHRIFLASGNVSHILAPGIGEDGETSSLCGIWSDKWLGEDIQDARVAAKRPLCNNCTYVGASRKIALVEPLTKEQALQTPLDSLVEDRDGERWRRKAYGWRSESGLGSITNNDLNRYHGPLFPVETPPRQEAVENPTDSLQAPVEDAAEKSLLEEEIDRQLLLLRADLVRMRIISGLSHKEVAARIGIAHASTVRKFEEGQKDVRLSFLRRYCLAIGVVLRWDVLVAADDDRAAQ